MITYWIAIKRYNFLFRQVATLFSIFRAQDNETFVFF
jgi:hypothetical protein